METFYGQFDPPVDKIIKEYFPDDYIGTAIDLGATDGIFFNNTLFFENRGWSVLCVEPNPLYFEKLLKTRKNAMPYAISDTNSDNVDFHIVHMLENDNYSSVSSLKIDEELLNLHKEEYKFTCNEYDIKVKARTIDYCLAIFKPLTIDFITIDIEGTELEALKGFNIRKWEPKLFIIENNYNEQTIEMYLKDFGYVKDQRVEVNDFFIFKG